MGWGGGKGAGGGRGMLACDEGLRGRLGMPFDVYFPLRNINPGLSVSSSRGVCF